MWSGVAMTQRSAGPGLRAGGGFFGRKKTVEGESFDGGRCYLAGLTGLEPAASGLTGQRSNQLNYNPETKTGRRDRA